MPFCDIDKDVSLYYVTNTKRRDATDLDYSKPTILLLPPIFFAATIGLREQFKDPRLSQCYNLIAFDRRNMGLTKAPLSHKRDGWVDAADLAVAHEILRLPPCHIFAVGTNSGGAALRFAALFPTKCLSLGLCASPTQPGNEPEWLEHGIHETLHEWCFPQDLDDLERACVAFSWYGFTGQASLKLEDEIIAWLQMNLPPTKRTIFLAQGLSAMKFSNMSHLPSAHVLDSFLPLSSLIPLQQKRSLLSDEELNAIEQPTIIFQGDMSIVSPVNKAQELCDRLPNGRLFAVKGGPELMNIIPEYASIIHRMYSQFLAGFSTATPILRHDPTTQPDPMGVCRTGLTRLAIFAHDSSIADRDPSTTLSFSRISAELNEQIAAQFAEFSKGESEAFHALNEYGRPIRKLSERNIDEWQPDAFRRYHMMPENASVIVSQETSFSEPDGKETR